MVVINVVFSLFLSSEIIVRVNVLDINDEVFCFSVFSYNEMIFEGVKVGIFIVKVFV